MSLHNISLSEIRELSSLEDANHLVEQLIPSERRFPSDFWNGYHKKYVLLGLKACLAMFVVMEGRIIPRKFQLEATLAIAILIVPTSQ
ncbi:hypothetical protein BDQ17DRAFT_1341916 [Cyathus striatus]|nr:hypothetical protein BDQ17DRAFT_1341916 [Cyathus striatus]